MEMLHTFWEIKIYVQYYVIGKKGNNDKGNNTKKGIPKRESMTKRE